jgi:cytochrome b561
MNTQNDRYSAFIRLLHWLMALGFSFMWGSGYYMTSIVEEDSNLEELLFGLHISIGVTLLFLLVLRIIIRRVTTIPPPVIGLSYWERIGSHIGHIGLYVLPALIIAIGWAETDFGGHGVSWFGIEMFKVFPTMESLAGITLETTTATLHKWLAYSMLALAVVHVAAAVKHRIDGHDILYRITFGKKRD